MVKKIIKRGLIALFILLLIYYASLVVMFNIDVKKDFNSQRERLDELFSQPYAPINEADFTNFDLQDSQLRLNEIQVLATHNSYKTMPNMVVSYPMSWVFGQRTKNGWYEMPYLTDQLNAGYRGIELDVCRYDNDFALMHDPNSDWRTNGSNFELALKEIKYWSDINPNHAPIHIMLQVRNLFGYYTYKYQSLTKERLIQMDAVIAGVFGDGIITPGKVKGDYDTLNNAVLDQSWPKVKDSLGKVYFSILFDQGKNFKRYVDIDPTFSTQQCFVFTRPEDEIQSYTAFILADDPFIDGLPTLIEQGYILRSRIDEQFAHSEARRQQAIKIGSTIMATDYPEGNLYKDGYVCRLTSDNKTVLARGSVVFNN